MVKYSNTLVVLLCIILLTTVGCVATRPLVSFRDPVKQLQQDIDAVLADSIFISTTAGIKIISLDSEKVLYEHASKLLQNPASNMKLLTSAAALSVLDTGYQFKTSVLIDDRMANGTSVRDIYLKGSGDPDLTSADLDTLAFAARNYGITKVENSVIVDDSFFDDDYWGDGWAWDDVSDPDAPYINALSVNKNCVRVIVSSDSMTVSVSLLPNTDFVNVVNRVALVRDSIYHPLKIRRLPSSGTNVILMDGELLPYSQISRTIPLCRPEYYAGILFKESLQRAGISVSGSVVNGTVPDGIHEITSHRQPIEAVITNMNKISDNLSAENILKIMGALQFSIPGSAKGGILVEKKILADLGMDTTKFSIADGSGVSRYNLFNAEQFIQFLAAMKKKPRLFPMFYNSLPIAGVDGTIEHRMSNSPAANNLHAKTGTLNGASCLSGYVLTRDGEMLAFSMLMQNFLTPSSDYRRAQDKIGSLLAGFSRKTAGQILSTK